MSKICKKPPSCKGIEDHQKYLTRISKTFYYGKIPSTDMLSLPVTELAVEIFSEAQKGRSLDRLHFNTAAQISRNACVSPCSLVLAMLYLERLKKCNVDYLERTVPSELFLVSLMVSSKFLFDDGEIDEVFMDEWAASSGMTCKELVKLEKEFLNAIDWKLYASELSFWKKLGEIELQLALKEGKTRGFFTYTELDTLADLVYKDLHNIVQCITAISIILAATYTAALLTMVASVALASMIPGTSLHNCRAANSNALPVTSNVVSQDTVTEIQPAICNDTRIPFTLTKHHNSFDAVKVLKASILLASIKSKTVTNCSEIPLSETDVSDSKSSPSQYITWDWWNVPVMNWLYDSSEYIKGFEVPLIQSFVYFLGNKATNEKFVYLEDHIHKSTKTRLQDQLERSWHVEWVDTIKQYMKYYKVLPYLQNIKS